MAYILAELDELEREEFYRLKKIQEKKKAIRDKAEVERLRLKAIGRAKELEDAEAGSIFDDNNEEDLLF